MSEQESSLVEDQTLVRVKYQCMHLTCRLQCYTGEIELTQGRFERLKDGSAQLPDMGTTMFKSPSMVCKIATTQDFRVVEFTNDNPIVHEETSNDVERLEEQRAKLKRSLQHEKEEFKRKEAEFKQNIQELTEQLKTLRAQERSRKMKKQVTEDDK